MTQDIENSKMHEQYTVHILQVCAWCTNLTFLSLFLFVDSGVGAGIDSYYEYLMKAYILLGDNVFLDRFNIVSLPLLHTHTEIYILAHIEAICIVLPVAPSVAHWCLFCIYCGCGLKTFFSLFADLFFMIFVCNSTTVPLWSTSVNLPCCLMCTCTTPLWACAAGWTLSWRSFLAYRSVMLC